MKEIQPVAIWYNGNNVNATKLNAYLVNDNLETNATFYYSLNSNDNLMLSSGNLTMNGTNYEVYNSNTDANTYAFEWIATQLNLILL